jgi:hypothetical protein
LKNPSLNHKPESEELDLSSLKLTYIQQITGSQINWAMPEYLEQWAKTISHWQGIR